jgi:hypothetical protein
MIATSPKSAGKETLNTLTWYWGNRRPVTPNDHVGKSVDGEPNAQKARQKTRFVHEHGQWEEPYSPKHLGRGVLVVTQTEKQHGERVPLRFVEYGQEILPGAPGLEPQSRSPR